MRISKQFRFEASHVLPRHKGKCSRLHGHSWVVEIHLDGPQDPVSQFVLDYGLLKGAVQPLIDVLDHNHLNDLLEYPSSENVAQWLGIRLRLLLSGAFSRLVVRVSETVNAWAEWDSALDDSPALYSAGIDLPGVPGHWSNPDRIKTQFDDTQKHLLQAQKQATDVMVQILKESWRPTAE